MDPSNCLTIKSMKNINNLNRINKEKRFTFTSQLYKRNSIQQRGSLKPQKLTSVGTSMHPSIEETCLSSAQPDNIMNIYGLENTLEYPLEQHESILKPIRAESIDFNVKNPLLSHKYQSIENKQRRRRQIWPSSIVNKR